MSVIEALTRVEGEGEVEVVYEKGVVKDVRIRILEPPRLFERVVLGLRPTSVPDVVSRICGICGVSHVLAAVKAFEDCMRIEVDERVERFRKVLHLVERVKSHILHALMMHLPDFVGARSVTELLHRNPRVFKCLCRLLVGVRKLMEILGGRFHNVVNIAVGGVHRYPSEEDARRALGIVKGVWKDFEVLADFVLSLEIPGVRCSDLAQICVNSLDGYPHNGREIAVVVGSERRFVSVNEFEEIVEEEWVHYSTAPRYKVRGLGPYIVGPTSRYNLFYDRLPSETRNLLSSYGWGSRLENVHQSIVARVAEIHAALMEIEEFLRNFANRAPSIACKNVASIRSAVCKAFVEAPRGVLYHSYAVDERGRVVRAKIITPTAQNLCSMEHVARRILIDTPVPSNEAVDAVRRIVRSFDPCISCSVHKLSIRLAPK